MHKHMSPVSVGVFSLVLLLFLLQSVPVSSTSVPSRGSLSVAGSVSVPANATQYVDVLVVEGGSGVVLRSMPLDATRSFAFAGLPETAAEVRLHLRLPERRFRLDAAASVLAAPIPKAGGGGGAEGDAEGVAALRLFAAVVETAGGPREAPGSLSGAAVTVAAIALAAFGRHWIVALLDLPSIRMPKPRRVVVAGAR